MPEVTDKPRALGCMKNSGNLFEDAKSIVAYVEDWCWKYEQEYSNVEYKKAVRLIAAAVDYNKARIEFEEVNR